MPVLVDEVVITVEVSNQSSGGAASGPPPDAWRQALVAECVEQVLEILRREREP